MGIDLWWDSLSTLGKVYGGLAVFSTLVFLLQTAISLMGAGVDMHDGGSVGSHDMAVDNGHGHDFSGAYTDHSASVLHFFTFRNIIAFFLGLSWGGLMMLGSDSSSFLSVIVGILIGLIMVALNLGMMRALSLLLSSGNIIVESAVGQTATVVIAIPPNKEGYGKVSVLIQEKMVEFEAITDGEKIDRGQTVKVLRIDGHLAVVQ